MRVGYVLTFTTGTTAILFLDLNVRFICCTIWIFRKLMKQNWKLLSMP